MKSVESAKISEFVVVARLFTESFCTFENPVGDTVRIFEFRGSEVMHGLRCLVSYN